MRSRTFRPFVPMSTRSTSSATMRACSAGNSSSHSRSSCCRAARASASVMWAAWAHAAFHVPAGNDLAYHWIAAKPVGVVDLLVASEARQDRLAQTAREMASAVLAHVRIGNEGRGQVSQVKGVVQFPVRQQAAVGTDRRVVEGELHRAVKFEPQRPGRPFTRRV